MSKVYIDTIADTSYLFPDEWKEYCYGPSDEFDEVVVITGNRHFNSHTTASWYQRVMEICKWFDYSYDREDFDLTDEQYKKAKEIYDKCRTYEDPDVIVEFLKVLYPGNEFKTRTIRGYDQGDWQECIWKSDSWIDIDYVESFYFGKVAELHYSDGEDNYIQYVTDDELWKAEYNKKIEELVRENLPIPDDETIEIYKSNGYTMVKNWERMV